MKNSCMNIITGYDKNKFTIINSTFNKTLENFTNLNIFVILLKQIFKIKKFCHYVPSTRDGIYYYLISWMLIPKLRDSMTNELHLYKI